jgi:hypothetical protein
MSVPIAAPDCAASSVAGRVDTDVVAPETHPESIAVDDVRETIARLRRYGAGEFAHTISDPLKRTYAKGGYLLALEHLEKRLTGPLEGSGSPCQK